MEADTKVVRSVQQRPQLSDQSGFGVIEVLVSALVVVLLSLAVFSAFDAAGRTADANKSRSVAAGLATSDIERMRAMTITAIAAAQGNLTPDPPTKVVDGKQFTFESRGEFVLGPADATDCTGPGSGEQSPRYLKLTSTVDWAGRRGVDPVKQETLRAVPTGSTPQAGTASIGILNRDGAGVPAVSVTLTGPGSPITVVTNDNGCAVFGFIQPGNYTVSFAKPGFVEKLAPNRNSISDQLVVASDGVATKAYVYDQAGGIRVQYRTTNFNTNTESNTNGDGFTVSNALLGTPSTKLFEHGSAGTSNTGLTLFPFASPANYSVWAGECAENKPPDAYLADATYGQTIAVPRGAYAPSATTNLDIREPRLRVKVQRRTTADGAATNNYAVMPNAQTTIKFNSTTTGCVTEVTFVGGTANGVTRIGDTTASGGTNGNFTTYEAILPFGSYTVCAAYNGSTSQRAKATAVNVPNQTSVGSLYAPTITVPFNQTSGYTC